MAFGKKYSKKRTTKTQNIDVQAVRFVHQFDDGNVSFSLLVNGIWISNMSIINNEKAKDGWFISFPSRKAQNKDGKDAYYNYAYFFIDDATKAKIGEMVQKELN